MPRQTSAAAAADAASADSGEGQQVHIRSSAVLRVELAAVRPSVRGSCRAGGAAGVRVALRRVRIRRLRRVEPLEEMRRARRRRAAGVRVALRRVRIRRLRRVEPPEEMRRARRRVLRREVQRSGAGSTCERFHDTRLVVLVACSPAAMLLLCLGVAGCWRR